MAYYTYSLTCQPDGFASSWSEYGYTPARDCREAVDRAVSLTGLSHLSWDVEADEYGYTAEVTSCPDAWYRLYVRPSPDV